MPEFNPLVVHIGNSTPSNHRVKRGSSWLSYIVACVLGYVVSYLLHHF